ncbi:hypothetical protein [Nocardioides daphniae]|uniref:Uncharacterized protein n=1 Tax=Nocardioides daphniae TaxID=402297 RepID=A0A4P7UDT6_9ACTN|nr:hypothetical protein [Nocardioides daphniae]QCC78266.1 hypothetical protein E2C04_15670 [Nocardioides daphniae]
MRRRTSTLRPLLSAGLLSLALLLTGCAKDEPKPKFEEPAASPTPTPVEETAEEFLERWARLDREMQNTGETEEYRAITPGCKACIAYADRVDKIYAAGGEIVAEGKTIQGSSALGTSQVLVSARIGPPSTEKAPDPQPGP